jgi:uncharacterized membrane protein
MDGEWLTFFGRFHPLWLHLPIGFLVLATLLKIYGDWKGKQTFDEAVSFSLLLGAISALVAALLGFSLSQSGGYEDDLLVVHQIGGWATVLFSGLAWWISIAKRKFSKKVEYIVFGILLLVLSVTGHFGGSLTHGKDYLSEYAPFGEKKETEERQLNSLEEAILYTDVVQPILKTKCVSCHREGKSKGGLKLDSFESLTKGGESGAVILAGNSGKSELVRRVTLPESHEDYMPAEGKKPLTEDEVKWISWWIETGNADPGLRLVDSHEELIAWAEPGLAIRKDLGFHASKADTAQLNILKKIGFRVRVISHETGALDVVLPEEVSNANPTPFLEALEPVKNQIRWLSLAGTGLTDKELEHLSNCVNLERLRIENNPISDKGLAYLGTLSKLEVLNLNGSGVTGEGLAHLSMLKNLKSIYLWGTAVNPKDEVVNQLRLDEVRVVFGD